MGLTAADLTLRNVGTSETIGLGRGGAGVYTANNWLNTRSDRVIYVEGAVALQCALTATESLQSAYPRRQELKANLEALQVGAASLDTQLIAFTGTESDLVIRARNTANRARALISVAGTAFNQLEQGGTRLYAVVGKVEVEVERPLQAAAPDFNLLAASLINIRISADMWTGLADSSQKTAFQRQKKTSVFFANPNGGCAPWR